MRVDQWIEKAKDLRARMFEDEAAFYLFLVDGEAGDVEWKGAATSFEELLDETKLCKVSKYVSFRNALQIIDRQQVSTVGVDGAILLAEVKDSSKRDQVVLSLDEERRRRQVPPTGREVARVIQQIAPTAKTTRDLVRALGRDKLEQEVRALRRRVRELEAQNKKLQADLDKAKSKRKAS